VLYIALIVIYVIICFFLILVVLLQQGKGADIAGAFGGGGSQTAFGARGATTFLHKLTTGAFVGFIVLSIILSIMEARPKKSVIQTLPAAAGKAPAPAPGAPAGAPAPAAPAPDSAQPSQGTVPSTPSKEPVKP
jgi:preprotein translocase subunit SecG